MVKMRKRICSVIAAGVISAALVASVNAGILMMVILASIFYICKRQNTGQGVFVVVLQDGRILVMYLLGSFAVQEKITPSKLHNYVVWRVYIV
jgi:hypothetical protein